MPDVSPRSVRERVASWWNNAPLLHKTILIAIVPMIIAIGAPLAGTILSSTVDDADHNIQIAQERQVTALTLETLHNDAITYAGALVLGGASTSTLAEFGLSLQLIENARRDLLVGPMDSEEFAFVTQVRLASEATQAYVATSSTTSTGVSVESVLALSERNGALTAAVNDFIDWETRHIQEQTERRRDAARWRTRTSWGGALVGGGFGVAALAVGLSNLQRRVQNLRGNAQRLEQGQDLLPVVPARDEIGQLEEALQIASRRLRQREQALRVSEERFRLAFADANVGVALADIDGLFVEVNAVFADLLGYQPHELRGMSLLDVLHVDDRAAERARLADARRDGHARHSAEKRYLRRNGDSVWGMTHASLLRGADGDAREFVIMVQDVSERRRLEEELRYQAMHDGLTGLPNRTQFEERMQQVLTDATRGQHAAVVYLDLDGFKNINDEMGHAVGDAALQHVASRIRAAIRPHDTVARLGGDEFVLLLTDVEDATEAGQVVERVLRSIDAPMTAAGKAIMVRSSAGIVMTGEHSSGTAFDLEHEARVLLQEADAALYYAKSLGGARFVYATDITSPSE